MAEKGDPRRGTCELVTKEFGEDECYSAWYVFAFVRDMLEASGSEFPRDPSGAMRRVHRVEHCWLKRPSWANGHWLILPDGLNLEDER